MNNDYLKIAYVVLHYKAIKVTVQCIEKILNIKSNDSSIVVVDNCSPDNSGDLLKKKYADRDDVCIILNTENVGFAKGNNIGYSYARNVLKCNIVVDINNDVFIDQPDFEKKIQEIILKDKSIGVISPVIINRKGNNQNPFRYNEKTTKKWKRQLFCTKVFKTGLSSHVFWKITLKILNRNNKEVRKKNVLNSRMIASIYNKKYKSENSCYGIVPHGSCVIFTPAFLAVSSYGFVPITFFYCEEDILFDYLKMIRLKSFYSPSLYVGHMEKVSTNNSSTTERDKAIFQMKSKADSIRALIHYRIKVRRA
ncbi:Glycosyl transferase family 2 [Ruminococcaceae bacterium FB2012]|nr:Glycosyl transferase family 2 [Ruminococcaceae bacterium FB2012]